MGARPFKALKVIKSNLKLFVTCVNLRADICLLTHHEFVCKFWFWKLASTCESVWLEVYKRLFFLSKSMWLEFACPANQHPKSTIKKKKPRKLCTSCEFFNRQTFCVFSLCDLCFVQCSFDLGVLCAQRIIGCFIMKSENPVTLISCHLLIYFSGPCQTDHAKHCAESAWGG